MTLFILVTLCNYGQVAWP